VKPRRQSYGWNIAASGQRVCGMNRTEKFAVEIFRIVFAENYRRIGKDRERMNKTLFERECINKRL